MSKRHEWLEAVHVQPGDVLAGKYRVERVLGVGGMGVVVAAFHVELHEKVALKFLLPDAVGSSDSVARFVREARAAARIKSEHVARVSDVGTLPNGMPYMVMEYLEGGDLSSWLKERGSLSVEQAVDFVLQACVAVADAHTLGIVHRDLKPANLFCIRRSDGQLIIKVLDFGISKVTDAGGESDLAMTSTSALMGSPIYMSPEQMRSSRDVDARTDIWALGIVLWEMITGRPPFAGGSVAELAIKVASEPPGSMRSGRPDVPVALEAVVLTCLQKDRGGRYATVAELAVALLPFASARARPLVDRVVGIVRANGPSTSAPTGSALPTGEPTRSFEGTLPAIGRTTRRPAVANSGLRRWAFVGVAALGVAATVAVVATKAPSLRGALPPAAKQPLADTVASGVLPTAEAKPFEPGPAEPPAAGPMAPVAASTATKAPPRLIGPGKPAAAAAPAAPSGASPPPPSPPPPKATVDCDPPYYFNASGSRVFKKECL